MVAAIEAASPVLTHPSTEQIIVSTGGNGRCLRRFIFENNNEIIREVSLKGAGGWEEPADVDCFVVSKNDCSSSLQTVEEG